MLVAAEIEVGPTTGVSVRDVVNVFDAKRFLMAAGAGLATPPAGGLRHQRDRQPMIRHCVIARLMPSAVAMVVSTATQTRCDALHCPP